MKGSMIDKDNKNPRLPRLATRVEALNMIQTGQFARVVEIVRALAQTVRDPLFDFESACNMLALLAQLADKSIQLDEVDATIANIARRFCSNRSLTELLAASASAHPPYADAVRNSQTQILEYAEVAMSLSMSGNATAAIKNLVLHGRDTLNARLVDNAFQLLQKHATKVQDAAALRQAVEELQRQCGPLVNRATLGEQKRQAGGLALRTGKRGESAPDS